MSSRLISNYWFLDSFEVKNVQHTAEAKYLLYAKETGRRD